MKVSRLGIVLSTAFLGFSVLFSAPSTAQSGISTTTWYTVVNQNSGSCVDDSAGGTANGTSVQQWACVSGSTNQQWQFQSTSNGNYKVVSKNNTSEVWDVTGVSTASGALIQLWSYGGGANQQWTPVALDSTHYKFVNVNSGLCLDVPSASTANGVQLQQYTCNGTAAQSWSLVAVGGSPTNTPVSATNTPTVQPPTNTPVATATTSSTNGSPYGGTAPNVPGKILAAYFNTGGEGVAYHDVTSPVNNTTNPAFRTTEGVDLENCSDTGCGYDIGWTDTGEWEKYTVNVTTAGTYNIDFRVASGGSGGALHLEIDGNNVTGSLAVPATGGWQTWTTVTKTGVNFSAGSHVLRLYVDTAGYNIWYFNVYSPIGVPSPTPTKTAIPTATPNSGNGSPYGGTAPNVPGKILAAYFNTGGEGVAYHDVTSPVNNTTNPAFRTTEGVDLENCSDTGCGYDIGWTDTGEWEKYTVNVTTSGTYNIDFRVASGGSGGALHLEIDGNNVTGSVAVPGTGGWQTWTTVTKTGVNFTPGTHVLRLYVDTAGYNIWYFNVYNSTSPTSTPGATAVGAPAKPSIAITAVTGSSTDYDVTWNIWYGTNATSWQLLENGQTIASAPIAANSPNAQTATYRVTGKTYGAYSYTVIVTNSAGSTSSDPSIYTVGGASKIYLPAYDGNRQALQITLAQGTTNVSVSLLGASSANFTLATNNSNIISFSMANASTISITGLKAGRAGLQITDTISGTVRYVGIRVKTAAGANPGMPAYVAVGSESEDTTSDLTFWHAFASDATNKRIDVRYIYLNAGWRSPGSSSLNVDGGRLISYLRESLKLGIIPFFVYYNIPSGGESYSTDLSDMQNASYMQRYYTDLKFALDTIRAEAGDELVGFVLEPDAIGYMMQNSNGKNPTPATQISASVSAAYSAGVLNSSVDPNFPNTLTGLVQSVNYIIHKFAPNPFFGWEFSLWASPGITVSIPTTGLIRITDSMGISSGRNAIVSETQQIVNYYMTAGVTSYGANFVSVDKYGLDAGSSSPDNPSASTWFWNADHWNNYLLFLSTLHTGTNLPVIPWQIPQGHINSTKAVDPYPGTNGVFADLTNTSTKYEDSSPDFFLGDTFAPGTSVRFNYFATNLGGDSKITSSGGTTVSWGSHILDAKTSGVIAILFGPGVGDSTDGVGTPAADGYWWITAVQRYYASPVSLP